MNPDPLPPDVDTAIAGVKRRGHPRHQVVDPGVSRVKFEREVEALRRHEPEYRRQGWFLLSAQFPEVFLVLTVPHLRPAPILFGVVIDFVNYDVDPPSIQLVHAWTREPLRARELLSPLPRLVQRPQPPPVAEGRARDAVESPAEAGPPESPAPQAPETPAQAEAGRLMQWWTPESLPFLCMRGVREYHRHPAHTGDSWLLHRGRGEGTLAAILSAIHAHGCSPIRDYVYEFSVQTRPLQHNAFIQQVTARINGFLNVLPDGSLCPWTPN